MKFKIKNFLEMNHQSNGVETAYGIINSKSQFNEQQNDMEEYLLETSKSVAASWLPDSS